jgi:hypothetical protein
MDDLYHDKWITCDDDAIVIRWYSLWGAKRIPYSAIRGAKTVTLGPVRGKGRIWGTANPRYWASLDPARMSKDTAIILDTGGPVHPYLTPDDVPTVAQIIRERARLTDVPQAGHGPVI